jgi:hypothetical protein
MVDVDKIRENLGTRDSIGLKREVVLELLAGYVYATSETEYKEPWSWSDFAPKH